MAQGFFQISGICCVCTVLHTSLGANPTQEESSLIMEDTERKGEEIKSGPLHPLDASAPPEQGCGQTKQPASQRKVLYFLFTW
ncbi:shieldin complex subunit 1 isoform X3 [Buteo buteo]|uniref:shieldin complex subunit 1 isoform X3 n=1 Tax=Buteo buteo TaxID=30397 RepID=UPI003EBDF659